MSHITLTNHDNHKRLITDHLFSYLNINLCQMKMHQIKEVVIIYIIHKRQRKKPSLWLQWLQCVSNSYNKKQVVSEAAIGCHSNVTFDL